jgi:uncharacterized protein YggE
MPEEPRTISVTGEALVKVIPDYVVITLVVETIEKELPKARVANDDRVKRLLAAAHAHGVAETDIATDQIQIAPRYEGSYERVSTRPVAYEVEKTVVLTLRELATFEPLLAACLDTGAGSSSPRPSCASTGTPRARSRSKRRGKRPRRSPPSSA